MSVLTATSSSSSSSLSSSSSSSLLFHGMLDIVYEYFVVGGLKKKGSWGGDICFETIKLDIHLYESLIWTLFILFIFRICRLDRMFINLKIRTNDLLLKQKQLKYNSTSTLVSKIERIYDYFLLILHSISLLLLLYYKMNLHSLINMFQPCHITLVLQTFALYSNGKFGILIGVLLLPMTLGSLMAIIWPATDGLDQPYEYESFWVLHILIQTTPLYLLIRKNFAAYKLTTLQALLLGNWFNVIYHWWFIEPLNLYFKVKLSLF